MQTKTRKLVTCAIMGAIGLILMMFSFPLIPGVSFLKLDFSDVPVFLMTFVYGPSGGLITALVRNILNYLRTGGDMGYPIGNIASFLASAAYVLPVYYLSRDSYAIYFREHKYTKESVRRFILSYLAGTLSLTIVMSVLNYFVITPFYLKVMNLEIPDMKQYILYAIVPFNLLKGLILGLVSHFLLVKLLPIVKRNI